MSQYKTGTVAVTNGSQAIVGTGTAWLTNAAAGQVFSIDGSGVPYVIGSVTDDTHATLTANYAGATASGQPYSITTSYTPAHSLPYPENGDVDTATILKRAMLLIDGLFTAATAYADSLVVGLLDDRGNYDASGNTFPASGGSGAAGAIKKGDIWYISVAGTLGGTPVIVGDTVRALADTPGQTAGNWVITASASEDIAANIHAATANTTPADAVEFGFWDNVAGALRKCSLTNLKAVLRTYFDTQYAALAGLATQTFSVAAATDAAHAVRSDQISTDNINFPIYTAPATWTPIDASGAGLTFTSVTGYITKIGKFRIARFALTFPVTADGSGVSIGGLPEAAASHGPNSIQGFFTSTSTITSRGCYGAGGSSAVFIDKNNGAAVAINSDFSGCVLYATLFYEVA